VYWFDVLPEVRDQVAALPAHALPSCAELVAFLELTPWAGAPYRRDNPEGAMRHIPFGRNGEGLALYLVLEPQRRVVMLSITWVD